MVSPMNRSYTSYRTGTLLVIATVALGTAASGFFPALGRATAVILTGILIGNLGDLRSKGKSGIKFFEKKILNIAIALIGFELEFQAMAGLDGRAIFLVVGVILISILCGLAAGRFLPVSPRLALLLGIGNGVCGSAAIMASAPVIKAEDDEIGVSVGVVNFLGAAGIFILPALAGYAGLSPTESGMLLGGTLQAMGQTVAAGLRMGPEIAKIAAVIKMARVLLLGVVLIGLSLAFRKEKQGGFPVPSFIIAFILAALAVNLIQIPPQVLKVILSIKSWLLLTAMAAIGLSIDIRDVYRNGAAALTIGASIFAVTISLFFLLR